MTRVNTARAANIIENMEKACARQSSSFYYGLLLLSSPNVTLVVVRKKAEASCFKAMILSRD